MAYKARTFSNSQEFVDYLNGVVLSNQLALKTFGLHGLTLIINNGVDRVVTFVDATGLGLTAKEILTQILAVAASLAALRMYGNSTNNRPQLAVLTATWFVKSTGTANTKFGFSTTSNTTVTPIVQANIVSVVAAPAGNGFTVVHA
jgi:hypothetical protein